MISGEVEWAEHPNPTRADAELATRGLRAIDAVLGPEGDPVRRGTLKLRLSTLLSWGTGETVEGERVAREAETLFKAAGDPANALLARHEAAWARGLRGDVNFLASESEAVFREAEDSGNMFLKILSLVPQGFAFASAGRFAAAEQVGKLGIELARTGMRRPATGVRTVVCLSTGLQGRRLEARRLWDETRSADPNLQDGPYIGLAIVAMTFVGDLRTAIALTEERLNWSGLSLTPRQTFGLSTAAHAARETGAPDAARRYLALSRQSHVEPEWWTEGAMADGIAALLDADEGVPGAIEHLTAAIARLEAMPAPPIAAMLLLELAEHGGDGVALAAQRLSDIASALEVDVYQAMAQIAAAWESLAAGRDDRAVAYSGDALAVLAEHDLSLLRGRAHDVLGRGLMETDPTAAREAFALAVAEFDSCGAVFRRERATAALERLAP